MGGNYVSIRLRKSENEKWIYLNIPINKGKLITGKCDDFNFSYKFSFNIDDIEEIEELFELRSGGGFGRVYNATSLHVIRIGLSELDGWRVIPYIPEEIREKYSLPRILRHWYDKETNHQITIVEKLRKLPYELYSKNPVNLEIFNWSSNLNNDIIELDKYMEKDNPFYNVVSNAIDALQYCNSNGLNLCGLDLNHSNIMMRNNGELVLSDPFGTRDI